MRDESLGAQDCYFLNPKVLFLPNTCRVLFVLCCVLGLGGLLLCCVFGFLFCKCFGIPNSPRSLDPDDRQGLIASSAMQQKKNQPQGAFCLRDPTGSASISQSFSLPFSQFPFRDRSEDLPLGSSSHRLSLDGRDGGCPGRGGFFGFRIGADYKPGASNLCFGVGIWRRHTWMDEEKQWCWQL